MTITINNDTKNTVNITNDSKPNSLTWDEATFTWDNAAGTWDVPGTVFTRDSKNNLSITNESK